MIKEIVKDIKVLQQKSEKFEFGKDEYLIQDMIDTAEYHKERCVGLACIQIGTPKRVILVRFGDRFIPFINPIILQKSREKYTTTEGCLSLDGEREVCRHKTIKVGYTTQNKKTKLEVFSGFIAEIIQHECDHLNGILI
jgi:peptide deformylase